MIAPEGAKPPGTGLRPVPKKSLIFVFLAALVVMGAVLYRHARDGRAQQGPSPSESSQIVVRGPGGTVSPLRVSFVLPPPAASGESSTVEVLLQRNPDAWPEGMERLEGRLELLLRLPIGVKLESSDWKPAPLPAEENEDATGPWSLYAREIPLSSATVGDAPLVSVPLPLAVVEEGTNWIISLRARVIHGETTWTTFGVLFATTQKGQAEFHAVPRPTDAQKNRP